MPRNSLRARLMMWLLGPLVIVMFLEALANYQIALEPTTEAYDYDLTNDAYAIAELIRAEGSALAVDITPVEGRILTKDRHDQGFYAVYAADGTLAAGSAGLPRPASSTVAQEPLLYDADVNDARVRMAALAVATPAGEALVLVAKTLNWRERLIGQLLLGSLASEALTIVATIGLVFFGIRRGLIPLHRLQRELAQRSPRDLTPLAVAQIPSEIQPLILTLNALLSQLDEALTAERRFLANAAHQLRTPLSGLQAMAELAVRESDSSTQKALLLNLCNSAQRAGRLANQLLSLARAESDDAAGAHSQRIELDRLIGQQASAWVLVALRKNQDLGFELQPATILGHPLLLGELLSNLVDNAVHYCPECARITVRTLPTPDRRAVLEVEDDGPGIPHGEREKVLRRFYRPEDSPGEGCGLGLAIVNEIAELHGAQIAILEGADGRGTRVRLEFPDAGDIRPEFDQR